MIFNGLGRISAWLVVAALAPILAAGCDGCGRPDAGGTTDPSRGAEADQPNDPFGDSVSKVVYLDQGWTPQESEEYYARTQGSRLIPYSWAIVLAQPDSTAWFFDEANVRRFRYLPQKRGPLNPDGLPVGLVKNGDDDWMGFTCAACHTNQVNYKGTGFRIDGGPGQADVQGFLHELTRALKATLDDPAKFARFAAKVLKGDASDESRKSDLKAQLTNVYNYRRDYDERNRTDQPYGYARVDAFGIILNEVLEHDLGVPENHAMPDAPVSYPFLWDTPQHDYVQWNGSAPNAKLGALSRNIGEVLGVFGELKIEPGPLGYESSVRVLDLDWIERRLTTLWSPRWPEELPPIDPAKRDAGRALFQTYCARCHRDINRTDPDRKVTAVLTPLPEIGTDPRMAMNFANRRAKTGKLKGHNSRFLAPELVGGVVFGDESPGDEVLINAIVGTIIHSPFPYQPSDLMSVRRPPMPAFVEAMAMAPGPSYKARPLNGIWATAPYLHNGSVPSLYQLLLPAKDRVKDFSVGRQEFDPVDVGFVSTPVDVGFRFRTVDDAGKPIPGNSNAGHEYGTGGDGKPPLTEPQRRELVEYLKSL